MKFAAEQRRAPLFLILISCVLYFPVLSMTFLSDDYGMTGHFQLRDVLRCFYAQCGISENAAGWYRPTSVVFYYLEYHLWGHNPAGYHLTNLILYMLCVLAFYFFSSSLLGDFKISFAAALIFAAHPVHGDAVAWICERHTLLAVLFLLLSFLFFIKSMEEQRRLVAFSVSIIFFMLALCSKEDAVILPVVLFLYGLMLNKRVNLLILSPFFVLVCLYVLFKFFVLKTLGGYGVDETFFATPIKMLMKYTLAVRIQQLSVPYIFNSIVLPWFLPFAIVLFFLCLSFMKLRLAAFLTGFLIIAFLPYVILPINVWMGGWYLYFASIPFCILVARCLLLAHASLSSPKILRKFSLACFIVLVVFYTVVTRLRINDWLYASRVASGILPKIASSLPREKNNLFLHVYGVPHNHKGAYIFANGFEIALRMYLKDARVTVKPTFLLNLPTLQSIMRAKTGTRLLVYLDGNIYRLLNHPRKEKYYFFLNTQGKSFSISNKDYLRSADRIVRKYASGGGIGKLMLTDMNREITEGMKKYIVHELHSGI